MHFGHIELLILFVSIAFCIAFSILFYRKESIPRRILYSVRLLICAAVSGLIAAWIPRIIFQFPPAVNMTTDSSAVSPVLLYAGLFAIMTVSIMLPEGCRHLFIQIAVFVAGTALFGTGLMLVPQPAYVSSMSMIHDGPGRLTGIPVAAFLVFLVVFAVLLRRYQTALSPGQRVLVLISCLAFFAASQYIIILAVLFRIGRTAIERTPFYITVSTVFLLGVFIPLLLIVWQLEYANAENKKFSMQIRSDMLDKEVFQHLTSVNQMLREMKHDTQKHLDVIRSFAEKEDIHGLLAYIDTYDDSLEPLKNLVSTGNIVIDNIVSDRLRKAAQAGIPLTHKLFVPKTFAMDAIDLTSVLANLLDNAIEACIRAREQDASVSPQILFSIRPYHGMILIHCENTFDGSIRKSKQGTFLSVKAEPGHGHGLAHMQMLIDSVDGFMSITPEPGKKKFTVHILIPKAGDTAEVSEHAENSDH